MGPRNNSEPKSRKPKNTSPKQVKAKKNSKVTKSSVKTPAIKASRKSSKKATPPAPLAPTLSPIFSPESSPASSPASSPTLSSKSALYTETTSEQANPLTLLISRSKPVKVVPLEYGSLPHYSYGDSNDFNSYNYNCNESRYTSTNCADLKSITKQLPVNSVENKMESTKINRHSDNQSTTSTPIDAKLNQQKKNFECLPISATVLTPPLSPDGIFSDNSDIDVIACSDR